MLTAAIIGALALIAYAVIRFVVNRERSSYASRIAVSQEQRERKLRADARHQHEMRQIGMHDVVPERSR